MKPVFRPTLSLSRRTSGLWASSANSLVGLFSRRGTWAIMARGSTNPSIPIRISRVLPRHFRTLSQLGKHHARPAKQQYRKPSDAVNCNEGIVRQRANTGVSDYNGLQLELRSNQLWHQLTLRTNYTYSVISLTMLTISSNRRGRRYQRFLAKPCQFPTGTEHGLSGLDFPNSFTMTFYEQIPLFRSQEGLVGHLLGGWAVAGTYFITSGQTYTPIQFALNGGGPLYDNAFTAAFAGTVDQNFAPLQVESRSCYKYCRNFRGRCL